MLAKHAAAVASLAALSAAIPAQQLDLRASPFKYVASISVDGLHQSDLDKYLAARPRSNISALVSSGYQFTNSFSSAPSDSFPGTVAIWSGAEPRLSGVFYDNSYSRLLYPPGSNCRGPRGTNVVYDEAVDLDSTQLYTSIDAAKLPLSLVDGRCEPFYPHQYLRTNTAFEIIRNHGLETAYTDKHPAYDLVRGPSGKGLTTGYFPENAAIASGLASAIAYDRLHTDAVLSWLDGVTPANSEGKLSRPPALYGANYQALNVAQKAVGGGYINSAGNPPSAQVLQALDSIDAAVGAIVNKLKAKNVFDDTLISLAGKHGNSPTDPTQLHTISPAAIAAAIKAPIAHITTDDVALIWLNHTQDSAVAASQLAANKAALQIDYILTGANLTAAGFGATGIDERVPDIIVQPQHGVIYTDSKKKIAEHGGLTEDDRHVVTLLSAPRLSKSSFSQRVYTTYLAPLFVLALGQNPAELNAVQAAAFPGFPGFVGY